MSKILALIPARSGSKGLKNKIILQFNKKPLLFWSIESAKNSKIISDIMISSDSDSILNSCKDKFNQVLIDKRPDYLSSDSSKTIDLLKYIVELYPKYDYICVLQPTSPLRDTGFIDKCCKSILTNKFADVLASGYISHAYKYGSHQNKSRQELGGFFYDDGNVYILKKKLIKNGKWYSSKRIEIINKFPSTLEIDTFEEFKILEIIHKKKQNEF